MSVSNGMPVMNAELSTDLGVKIIHPHLYRSALEDALKRFSNCMVVAILERCDEILRDRVTDLKNLPAKQKPSLVVKVQSLEGETENAFKEAAKQLSGIGYKANVMFADENRPYLEITI